MTQATDKTLFTPRHYKTDERIKIEILHLDYMRYREKMRGWTKIKDYTNNRDIFVRRASCGADCFCDAVYKETL